MTERPTFTAWLAGRTPLQLAAVLDRRPDATWGPPSGLDDLASRLSQPGSVVNAIAELPLPGFEMLHRLKITDLSATAPPAVATAPVPAAALRNAAAAAATDFTETVTARLDSLGRSGVPALKSGGVGAREVARLAKSSGTASCGCGWPSN